MRRFRSRTSLRMTEDWDFEDGYANADRNADRLPDAGIAYGTRIPQIGTDTRRDAVKCSSSFPGF